MKDPLDDPAHDQSNPFWRLNKLNTILKDEDERGLVLALSAFAEDCLGQVILSFLRPVKAGKELLEGFNAPLGTFSSRTKAAHALGLVTDEQFADLEHLRKIRNEFAHRWDGVSFDERHIAQRIDQMHNSRIDQDEPGKDRKDKLRKTMSCILVELQVVLNQMAEMKRRVPVNALHLTLTPPEPPSRVRQLAIREEGD